MNPIRSCPRPCKRLSAYVCNLQVNFVRPATLRRWTAQTRCQIFVIFILGCCAEEQLYTLTDAFARMPPSQMRCEPVTYDDCRKAARRQHAPDLLAAPNAREESRSPFGPAFSGDFRPGNVVPHQRRLGCARDNCVHANPVAGVIDAMQRTSAEMPAFVDYMHRSAGGQSYKSSGRRSADYRTRQHCPLTSPRMPCLQVKNTPVEVCVDEKTPGSKRQLA